jgi:hypothetical protein
MTRIVEVADACAIADRIGRARDAIAGIDDPDVAFLVSALADMMGGALTFEQAAGLSPSWRTYVAARRWNRALAGLRRGLCDLPRRGQAQAITGALRRYERSRWPADQRAGRPQEASDLLLFEFLRAGGPLSAERIRKVLAGLSNSES